MWNQIGPWPARLIILGVVLAAYAGSFDGGFVSDDIRGVQNNPQIRSLDTEHCVQIFRHFDGANYMPLKVLSLAIDYRVFGPEPTGFHITNLLLHILAAWLLHEILLTLELGRAASLLVALVWAVHPLQVESVAWISERKNVLSTLFLFAGFRTYLSWSRQPRAGSYLALLGLYALAILSKMTAVVLPALCLAYEFLYRFRVRRRDGLASLPLFTLAALIVWVNLAGNPVHAVAYHGGSPRITGLTSSVLVWEYLRKVILPTDLMVYYDPILRGSLQDPVVLLSVGGLVGLLAVGVFALYRRQRAGFWIAWFFITLAPMLNLVPFAVLMQDRYLYVPLVAPVVGLVLGLEAALRRGLSTYLGYGLALLALVGCVSLSLQRVAVFDSPTSFWRDWATRMVYFPSDRVQASPEQKARLALLRSARQENPTSAIVLANLGALYFENGQTDLAVRRLQAAHSRDPGNSRIEALLGRALARSGRLTRGEHWLARAAEQEPWSFQNWEHLARVRLEQGDVAGTRQALARLEQIHPAASPRGRHWADLRRKLKEFEAHEPPP